MIHSRPFCETVLELPSLIATSKLAARRSEARSNAVAQGVKSCDLHTAYLVLECGAYSERTLRSPTNDHVGLAL